MAMTEQEEEGLEGSDWVLLEAKGRRSRRSKGGCGWAAPAAAAAPAFPSCCRRNAGKRERAAKQPDENCFLVFNKKSVAIK